MVGGPFRATVRDKRVVRVIYFPTGAIGGEASGFPTIDALFDSARTTLEYGHAVRICYDARFGYPVSFTSVDVGQEWSTVFTMFVTKLHPLRIQ